mmetsp:Transcript_2408/g.3502  ORF Transcript_2408/g.3502 Transcript_2408/m.3502 type:complete len:580 (+) Transcript_2408:167-1906(+)
MMEQPLLSVEDNMDELSRESRYSSGNNARVGRKRSKSQHQSLIGKESLMKVFNNSKKKKKKPSLWSKLSYIFGLAFLKKNYGNDVKLDLYYEINSKNEKRDFKFRIKGLLLFIMAMTGVLLMILSQMVNFQWWYGAEDDGTQGLHIYDASAKGFEVEVLRIIYQSINIANCLCTIVCLFLLTDYYLYYAKIKQETWKFENVFLAMINTSLLRKYILEFIIISFTPIPFLESINRSFFSNKWALLMFGRYYLAIRVIRDFSRVYQKRSEIRTFLSDNDKKSIPEFGWHLTFRILFYDHTILILFITSIISTMTAAFCIWVVERNVHNKGLSFYYNNLYFTLVTMTTIGYGDYSPKETAGRLAAVLQGLLGILIVTIFSGVVINKLTPTKEQESASEYFSKKKLARTRFEECIRILQVQWLSKKGKCSEYYRHNQIKRAVKKLFMFRRLWMKIEDKKSTEADLKKLAKKNEALEKKVANLRSMVQLISDQVNEQVKANSKKRGIQQNKFNRKSRYIAPSQSETRPLFIVEANQVYPVRYSDKLGYWMLLQNGDWTDIPRKRHRDIFSISSESNERVYIKSD